MSENPQPIPPPMGAPLELCWRCSSCGEVFPRGDQPPGPCPRCHAPETELSLLAED